MTLTPRSPHERPKKSIRLGVPVVCHEAMATHDILKCRAAGGTDEEAEQAINLAAFAEGASRFAFAAGKWQRQWQGPIGRDGVPASPAFALRGATAAGQRGFDGA